MLNNITLMGRLVRDPELRRTTNGTPVCSTSLAVERDFKDQYGEKVTDFIDVIFWRSTAEFFANYFRKGGLALVTGRMQSRKYVDKNGNNRITWEVQGENVYFAGDRPKDTSSPAETTAPAGDFKEIEEDGELPF